MFKFSAVFMLLAATALSSVTGMAQDHAGHASAAAVAVNPGQAWRGIEESMRNLSDAQKKDDTESVSGYVRDMAQATDALLAAQIHLDLKPEEKEHLYNSLQNLKRVVDELVEASKAGDQVALHEAVAQASGVITLTRIDVPPGLLERISGAQVRAEIVNTPVLQKGVETTVTLRLKSAVSGQPLTPKDLKIVHTEIVHALVVDPQLADYTHAHPAEIDVPGEYTFKMTPETDCTYRLWADVTPVKGKQEYAMVDIPGAEGCGTLAIDKTAALRASVGGFTVDLKLPEAALAVGKDSTLSFDIVDKNGEAVSGLEPIMEAYAHVVGFYDDYRTIGHIHPMGRAPKANEDRGASPLSFHFKPERAGYVRLYIQVKIDGQEYFFPFGVRIPE